MRRALALLVVAALAPLPALGAAAPSAASAAGKQRTSAKVCKARAKRAKAERRRVTRRRTVRRACRRAGAKRVRWGGPRVTDGFRVAQPPATVPPPSTTPPPVTTPGSGSTPPPLGRLGVAATEFALRLSRTELAAGEALIELQNRGEDPHNLVILASSGGPAKATFPETGPGLLAKQRVKLTPGTYELLCTLPGHAQLGMQATLAVR